MSRPFASDSAITDDEGDSSMVSAFIPVFILALVLAAWFGFQAMQLRLERDAMRDVMSTQDKQMADSKKLRDSLDAIARGTAQLANAGNANARLVVDELKRRGVTISPDAPTTGPGPAVPAN